MTERTPEQLDDLRYGAGAGPSIPARRLSDRLLDEGVLVAQTYAGQDRLDPARPTLGALVAEALATAERRGEQRALATLREGVDYAGRRLGEALIGIEDLARQLGARGVEFVPWDLRPEQQRLVLDAYSTVHDAQKRLARLLGEEGS